MISLSELYETTMRVCESRKGRELSEDERSLIVNQIWNFMKEKKEVDPDYCGLDPFTTGPTDPFWKEACVPHDQADQAIMDGKPTETPLQSFRKFVVNLTKVTLKRPSVRTIAGWPLYVLIGGFGGILRQQQLLDKLNPRPKDLED